MMNRTRNSRSFADISGTGRHHKEGKAVISELLKEHSISKEKFIELTGAKAGAELLEKNAFALHFDSNEVTFQSTLMKRVCEREFGG
jgi:hypothetical protein